MVERGLGGRSTCRPAEYDAEAGWAKLPAEALYDVSGRIAAIDDFKLRRAAEPHALKLYSLFVARLGRDMNMANIGFDTVTEHAGAVRAEQGPEQ